MGADFFTTIAYGKDASEAFENARTNVRYDLDCDERNPDSGYTGTILEADGFSDVTNDGVFVRHLVRLLTERKGYMTQAAQAKLAKAVKMGRIKPWDFRIVRKERLAQERSEISAAIKAIKAKRVSPDRAHTMAYVIQRFDVAEKWGPALAIKMDKDHYLFCGLASS